MGSHHSVGTRLLGQSTRHKLAQIQTAQTTIRSFPSPARPILGAFRLPRDYVIGGETTAREAIPRNDVPRCFDEARTTENVAALVIDVPF